MSSDSEAWVTFSRKLVCSPSPSVCSLAERGEPGLEPALVSGGGEKAVCGEPPAVVPDGRTQPLLALTSWPPGLEELMSLGV